MYLDVHPTNSRARHSEPKCNLGNDGSLVRIHLEILYEFLFRFNARLFNKRLPEIEL
jgi:hypothetical protein